jgi:hypothetical protein
MEMEVASCTSADSGVDANSDVGSSSELMSAASDIVRCGSDNVKSEQEADRKDQEMIVEEDAVATSSNIPMTL